MATPTSDPTILAYMRALGFDQADAERQTARSVEAAKARTAFETPQIVQGGNIAQESVAGGYENRGLLRSSAYATDSARTAAGTQFQLGEQQMNLADQVSGMESSLAAQIAANRRNMAERLLQVGQQQYIAEGSAPYGG